jgi:SAM-dependent methyltransferase
VIETIWPRAARSSRFDALARRAGVTVGLCLVCGRPGRFRITSDNLREDVVCEHRHSFNRQRQLAYVLLRERVGPAGLARGLSTLPPGTRVWNLEAGRALHERLAAHLGTAYLGTEFLGVGLPSGATRGGIMHVDVQRTHFPDASFDVVLSSDVLEHVPDVAAAISETMRVLRPGGVHVFTVPFYEHRFTTERRAVVDEDGTIRHLLPAIYHDDPVSPAGVLVYNIFAPELLCELEDAGFAPRLHCVRSPVPGILGSNGIVVVARKPGDA